MFIVKTFNTEQSNVDEEFFYNILCLGEPAYSWEKFSNICSSMVACCYTCCIDNNILFSCSPPWNVLVHWVCACFDEDIVQWFQVSE